MIQAGTFILPYYIWRALEGGLIEEFGQEAISGNLLQENYNEGLGHVHHMFSQLLTDSTNSLMFGSCHLDRASNVEVGVERQILVIATFFNCG